MLHLRCHEDRSQAQIARELGLSQAHVSRLLRAALGRRRTELDVEDLHDAEDTDAPPAPTTEGQPAVPPARRRSGRILVRLPPSAAARSPRRRPTRRRAVPSRC